MASSRAPDDGGAELARLKTLCDALRGRLSSAIEAKQTSLPAQPTLVHGGLALIQLKEVHRSLWEVVHAFKEATQRANAGVDAAELKLQNLQYEKNHFLRQITHLRDFHPDAGPKIEMLNEEEFAKQAPPELLAVSKADDPHQYHLNRLELELRQRKALCEMRDARLAERAAVAERNAQKQEFLDGLQAQLQSLVTLSLPLQKLLDQRPTQRWNERRRLHLLAPPLQALFVRAVAYRDTAAPHLELAIVGDFSAAEELAAQRNSNTKSSPLGSAANALLSPRPSKRQRVVRGSSKKAGSGGGDKGGSGEGRGGPGSGRVDGQEEDGGEREDDAEEEAEEDEALRPHPLQVRVSFRPQKAAADDDARAKPVAGDIEEGEADEGEVEASDGKELQIQFSCLPSLGLIAAQILNQPRALLVNLFDDDAGNELPPGSCQPSQLSIAYGSSPNPPAPAEILSALLPAAPFQWAQRLGSPLPSGAISPLALPALRTFGQVIDALTSRVAARETLAEELSRLSTFSTAPPPPAAINMPPAPLVTKLTSWREILVGSPRSGGVLSSADLAALEAVPAWRCASQRVFTGTLERMQPAGGPTPVRLTMLVQIFADYPRASPRVLLRWASAPMRATAAKKRELPPPVASLAAPAALRLAQRHAAEATDPQLQQMEAELNAPLPEVAAEGAPFHLLWKIHRARMLLDVYLETESSGGGASAAVCGTLCNRRVRGRDRRKPFHFSRTTGQFDQAN